MGILKNGIKCAMLLGVVSSSITTEAAQKLIWQDDFGTFTEKGKYWVWDYSDLSNPKKVQKLASDGWTYELSDEVAGAKYFANGD